jgi:hypothetical protein
VTFAPTTLGAKSASVSIAHNAVGSPSVVALSGTGVTATPAISVSPASLAFGSQNTGTTSAVQVITVSNTGGANLVVSGVALVGTNPGQFARTTTCATVAPGASCTVSVTFAPTTAGAKSASVRITHNAVGSPTNVPLTGTGVVATPAISVSPASLAFGTQNTGTASAAQLITVSNTGGGTLVVNSANLVGANPGQFTRVNACASVAPGASCTVSVTFTPTTAGNKSATLRIVSNAAGSPTLVSLTGTAITPAPIASASPASLAFGSQARNTTSAAQVITLSNTGNATLVVSSANLAGANPGQFVRTNSCSSVAPGASCTISVSFAPTSAGNKSATLRIVSNAAGSPLVIALTGTGL